jgi:hypothetical protein
VVRNGATPDGRQRCRCRECGRRSTAAPRPHGYAEAPRELILRAYQERSSLRGLTRTCGVSRNTVTSWLKKNSRSPGPEQHGAAARPGHHPGAGAGRTLVLCALQSGTGLGRGGAGPRNAAGRRLLPRRPQPGELPFSVGARARPLAYRNVLDRFLGSVSERDSSRAAPGRGQSGGRDGPGGALEQHAAPETGCVCAQDAVVFQMRLPARGAAETLPASL